MTADMTLGQLTDNLDKRPDTMRKYWNRMADKFPDIFTERGYNPERELSADQINILSGKSGKKSAELSGKTERLKSDTPVRAAEKPTTPKPEKLPAPDGVPAATENDTAEKEPILRVAARVSADILAFVIVIGHAGLLWYDCATLWGIPGQIGGGIVFAAVLLAVLICTQSNLPRSSNTALWFVLFVDIAAWWVHFEVFKTPVVSDAITGSLCAFICASSFVALYLFRDSKLD